MRKKESLRPIKRSSSLAEFNQVRLNTNKEEFTTDIPPRIVLPNYFNIPKFIDRPLEDVLD